MHRTARTDVRPFVVNGNAVRVQRRAGQMLVGRDEVQAVLLAGIELGRPEAATHQYPHRGISEGLECPLTGNTLDYL